MYRTKLDKILKTEGRTQTWLAKQIGKTIPQVNGWVQGTSRPNDETKTLIAKALGRTVAEIFFDESVACIGDTHVEAS